MGHYWSEMRDEEPERNPKALAELGFFQPYKPPFYNPGVSLWVHRPCMQVFYVQYHGRLDEPIWKHGKECHGPVS